MPLKGIRVEVDGEDRVFTPQELLDFARTRPDGLEWEYEVLAVMLDGWQDRGDHLSTTALIGECDLNFVLERKTDFVIDIDSMWASFTGTMFHGQLERKALAKQTVVERRYWLELDGLGWVSCQPDVVDVDYGILMDWKTKDKLPDPRRRSPYETNVKQLQINRYIIDHAQWIEVPGWDFARDGDTHTITPYVGHPEVKVAVEPTQDGVHRPYEWTQLYIVYLTPRDKMKRLACTKSIDVPAKNGRTKKARIPDIWDDKRVLSMIRELYAQKRKVLNDFNSKKTLPAIPDGWQAFNGWLCGYCPVRQKCLEQQVKALKKKGSKSA